jgi:hypothetical protein
MFLNSIIRFLKLCSISLSFILCFWFFVDNEPFELTSQISITFQMQLLFILIVLLHTFVLFYFSSSHKINFSLDLVVALIVGYIALSEILSLRGAPLTSSLFGDTVRYVQLVYNYKENLLSSDIAYPPLWFMTLAIISEIFEANFFDFYKYASLIFPVFFAHLLYIVNQKAFGRLIGTFITLQYIFTLIIWREFAILITIPFLIYVFNCIILKSQLKYARLVDFKFIFFGMLLGLFVSFYYSVFFFVLPGLILYALGLVTRFNHLRFRIINLLMDFGIGLFLTFGFLVLRPLFQIDNLIFILYVLLIIVIKLLFYNLLEAYPILSLTILFLVAFLLLYAALNVNIGDRYVYDGINSKLVFNPNFDSVLSLLLFVILLYYTIDYLYLYQIYFNSLIMLVSFFASSLMLKYWLGARLYETGLVNLFPRADNVIYLCWNYIIILLVFAALSKLSSTDLDKIDSKLVSSNLLKVALIMVISIFSLSKLYVFQFSNWPSDNDAKRMAHEVCANYPIDFNSSLIERDFQEFLAKKC